MTSTSSKSDVATPGLECIAVPSHQMVGAASISARHMSVSGPVLWRPTAARPRPHSSLPSALRAGRLSMVRTTTIDRNLSRTFRGKGVAYVSKRRYLSMVRVARFELTTAASRKPSPLTARNRFCPAIYWLIGNSTSFANVHKRLRSASVVSSVLPLKW